jgi:hypothetical protein
MRSRRFIVRTAVVPASAAVLSAKGATTKIIVTGAGLDAPIELRDRDVVAPFNVWSGPGTSMNGVEGMDGFIVNWRAGAVEPAVASLQRFEISFFADQNPSASDSPVYVVSYGIDRSIGEEYVYLPGRSDPRWQSNVRSIIRGTQYEGHWFRATAAWRNVMRTYVTPHASRLRP